MGHDLLSELIAARIIKDDGKINSNWRSIISPELLARLAAEMSRLQVSSLSEVAWCLSNGGQRPTCRVCGRPTRFLSSRRYRAYCSARCAAMSGETKRRRAATNMQKYGVENVAQAARFQQKQRASAHQAFTARMIAQLGGAFSFSEPLLNSAQKFNFVCARCGTVTRWRVFARRLPRCYRCVPHAQSRPHVVIRQLLEELGVSFSEHNREIIRPFEVDFYLPDHRLAIEVNGVFWHSEENGKPRDAHQRKTLRCLENKVTLLHLFEDEIALDLDRIRHRLERHYLVAPHPLPELPDLVVVDGCWPLPQWVHAEVIAVSPPEKRQVDPRFSSQQLTLWDSGKLTYRKIK